jgi:iron complex outermembrane receptor protein
MRNVHMLGVSALALAIASPAFAQQKSAPDNSIEEIVVTATKREQTLQDVPISVAVTGQQTIERAQVRDLIDLQSVVPSLKVSQFNATGPDELRHPRLRQRQRQRRHRKLGRRVHRRRLSLALGRGPGRPSGSRTHRSAAWPAVDPVRQERVGRRDQHRHQAAAVRSGRQDRSHGRQLQHPSDQGHVHRPAQRHPGGAPVGQPEQARRLFTNVTTGNDVNDRDRWSIRGDLLWEPTDKTSVRVIADYNKISETCCAVSSIFNGPATLAIGGVLKKPIGDPSKIFDRDVIFNTDPSNDLSGKGVSGQIDHDLGFAKLTSITAYRNQKNASFQDVDFTGADLANKDDGQHHQDLHPGNPPGVERRRPVQLADRRLLPERKARYRPHHQLRQRHPRLCRGPERPCRRRCSAPCRPACARP